jgi:Ca2+-binding EF-hand superfamily protein
MLTFEEIKLGLLSAGYNVAAGKIAEAIQNADYMGNGQINYSEFLTATINARVKVREDDLWSVFTLFDYDNTGFISEENLITVME